MPQRASEIRVHGNVTGGHPRLNPPRFTWTEIHADPIIPSHFDHGVEWLYSDTPMANEYLDRLVPIAWTNEGMPAQEREQMMQQERDLRDRMRQQREREREEERERLRRRLAPMAKSIARRLRRG